MQDFEMNIADTIIDRLTGFELGGRQFYFYPLTLGKAYLVRRVIDLLEINQYSLKTMPTVEALRLAEQHTDFVCLFLAYHSMPRKQCLFTHLLNRRKEYFQQNMKAEDMASLLLALLAQDRTEEIMRHFKIDKEQERMRRVMKAKKQTNTYQFGGMSVYGTILDVACERYGWTYDYVLWGISATNLHLMLRDSIKTVYLTDEEKKHCHVPAGNMIDGNNEKIVKEYIKGQSWK